MYVCVCVYTFYRVSSRGAKLINVCNKFVAIFLYI